MRLKLVPSSVECPHHFLQAFGSSIPRSFAAPCSPRKQDIHPMVANCNPNSLLRSQSFNRMPKVRPVLRSCRSSLDGMYREEHSFHVQRLTKSSGSGEKGDGRKKVQFAERDRDLFLHSRCDFLEPMMLGIKPEFADRPDQETVVWATMEQKAKSLGIPLSLRMIKKKLQLEEGWIDSQESVDCPVRAAFGSMVSIIVELQSHALEMREALCKEDLVVIKSKVQKEMHSSFVWLFQQVFSRTPDLMLHVMVLLADFSVHSTMDVLSAQENQIQQLISSMNLSVASVVTEKIQIGDFPGNSHHPSTYLGDQTVSTEDMNLWNSLVDEATDTVLDHDVMQHFVTPVTVDIEPDVYEDFSRTDLLYQMNLALEPNNLLLLCNYAQFLQLVTHDYDR